jgi:eukaryotic-like serine/threonine-protein kinase
MATVYLAEDLKHRRAVAIKVLNAELAASLGGDRFLREIELAARLQHPHIVPLYDSGSSQGFLYYVMPFIEGESLRGRIDREKQLGLEDTLRIAGEVGSALAYAHSHGIVHRDIKPENIMLTGGHAVVTDFGIARAVTEAGTQSLTKTGTIIGTPAYMSPEQATGRLEIDGRSDTYSLACVIYEMIVGQPPFTGPTALAIIARHSMDAVSPPSIVRATIPESMEDALLRALAKVPADRFATTHQFVEALSAGGGPATGVRRRPTGATPVRRPPLHRRPLVLAVAGAAVLGVVAFATQPLWRAASSVAGAGLDPRNIAVLYFTDLTPKQEVAYLADALTEGLIAELAGVSSLHVISKNGVARYRDPEIPRDSIARALNVGTLVQGSVEEVGDRYRVSVRLVDGASGADFRAQAFDQSKGDPLKIRDTLAVRVAEFLRERLGEAVRLRAERAGTDDPGAWSLVQQAERAVKDAGTLTGSDPAAAAQAFARADSLLQIAENQDPRWIDPIVLRARVAYLRARAEREPRLMERFFQAGLGHSERALRMEQRNPDAFEVRGLIRYERFLRGLEPDVAAAESLLAQARADLEGATRLNPNQVGAWTRLSHLYYNTSDLVEANRAARTAYEADAYLSGADAILYRLFVTSYDLELFRAALDWCDKGRRRFPNDPRFVECRLWLLATNALDADVAEAWRLAGEAVRLTPERDRPFKQLQEPMWVAAVLGRVGEIDSARRVLVRSRGTAAVDPPRDLLGWEAAVRAQIGDKEESLRLMNEWLVGNPRHREGFRRLVHWWWRPLQDDPRFKAMIGVR